MGLRGYHQSGHDLDFMPPLVGRVLGTGKKRGGPTKRRTPRALSYFVAGVAAGPVSKLTVGARSALGAVA